MDHLLCASLLPHPLYYCWYEVGMFNLSEVGVPRLDLERRHLDFKQNLSDSPIGGIARAGEVDGIYDVEGEREGPGGVDAVGLGATAYVASVA